MTKQRANNGGDALMVECFLCQQQRQCGPSRYDGRNVPSWNVWICNICRSGNWDGIVTTSSHGQHIVAHLKANGIEVHLNEKGHLPIPGH